MRVFSLKLLILLLSVSAAISPVRADEGMWIPMLLKQLNEADMQSKGLKLSAEDIYSVNNSSLKDAIVHFNGGCTGEIISGQGLLITNHHCGYGQIQAHSTSERNYLDSGFWAMSQADELPNEGLYVTFIVRMEDVTKKVLSGVTDDMKARDRNTTIKNNIKEVSEESTKGTEYDAIIKPFYYGNQYYMFITETFTDIRLVGAPPASIGEFGGDTDNWMWPRHTGDFSIFRIYANAENKPAKYSPTNVPYQPKHYLPVNIEGIKEGDFTMVFGFPGRTSEYLSSFALDYIINIHNPKRIAFRDKTLTILEADMKINADVKLKYSHKKKSVSNSYKRFKGEIKGLNKLNAIAAKQDLEKKFTEAALNSLPHSEKYGNIIPRLEKLYKEKEKYSMARAYFLEFMYYSGPDMMNFAVGFRPVVGQLSSHSENTVEVDKAVARLKLKSKNYFKNLHLPTEKKLFAQLLQVYYENVDKCQRKHLRQILNMTWPRKISNKKLHSVSNVTPLSHRITKARWKKLGQILMQDEQTPTYCALMFARKSKEIFKSRIGRPPINLFDTLIEDLRKMEMSIESEEQLEETRQKARNEKEWDMMV